MGERLATPPFVTADTGAARRPNPTTHPPPHPSTGRLRVPDIDQPSQGFPLCFSPHPLARPHPHTPSLVNFDGELSILNPNKSLACAVASDAAPIQCEPDPGRAISVGGIIFRD